ncbi:MAG: methyl-accepting chemotaxis protein, partial [Firmicutes bacterium]|nr:methyl-accepting chemotaxis protein [Bacillota bacterium]
MSGEFMDEDLEDESVRDELRVNIQAIIGSIETGLNSLSVSEQELGELEETNSKLVGNMEKSYEEIITSDNSLSGNEEKLVCLKDTCQTVLSSFEDIKCLDHLLYIENLKKSIESGEGFKGQLDPTKCAFGMWYLKFKPSRDAEQQYRAMKKPHDQVHQAAAKIVRLVEEEEMEAAWKIYYEEIEPAVADFRKNFLGWGMKEGIEFVVSGIERSKNLNDDTLKSVGELFRSIEDIMKVVSIISTISVQINMLAVNGAIEAARTGMYGHGFAVVAGDIRNMATETDKNSGQIKEMLEEIRRQVREISLKYKEIDKIVRLQSDHARGIVDELMVILNSFELSHGYMNKALSENNKIKQNLSDVDTRQVYGSYTEKAGKLIEDISYLFQDQKNILDQARHIMEDAYQDAAGLF